MKDESMTNLEKAIVIATNAHMGQLDKGGAPYILHPLRVMMRMETIAGKIIALFHDVVEDTHITIEDLMNEGFSGTVLDAIDCVTKRGGETYNEYINRVISNSLSAECKLEDMRDNSNIYRILKVRKEHMRMIAKYHKAAMTILETYPQFRSRFELIR